MWDFDIVRTNLKDFIPIYLSMTMEHRKGYVTTISTTLKYAYQNIITLVCQYWIDPVEGGTSGIQLLTETSLFIIINLKKQLHQLTIDHSLQMIPQRASDNSLPLNASFNDPKRLKITAKVDRLQYECDPEDDEALQRHLEEMSDVDISLQSQKLISLRRRMSLTRYAVVDKYSKGTVTEDRMWDVDVVRAYLKFFLPTYLLITEPRKGHATIMSTTLKYAYQNIITLACLFCMDTVTGLKAGFKLLKETGLFIIIKKQLHQLTIDHNLQRTPRTKLFYGLEHLHAVVLPMFDSSAGSSGKRLVVLQEAFRYLLVFDSTCRPSSTGPTEEKWAKAGRYPKLGDIKIYRRAEMTYDIGLTLSEFKGYQGMVQAAVQKLVLRPVLYTDEVFLNPHGTVFCDRGSQNQVQDYRGITTRCFC